MKNYFLLLLFISITNTTFAHSDFFHTKQFGKVETTILTGYDYEEKRKVEIIGQLIEIL